jgi:hypothetical protein
MRELLWKLPLLRRLTQVQRGFLGAIALVLSMSLAFVLATNRYLSHREPRLLESLAQIGATLLVAYAVEVVWLLKTSRTRGDKQETFVGAAAGLGTCGVIGIAFALALSEHRGPSWATVEKLEFAWSAASLVLLGGLVGLLPVLMYDLSHSLRNEYSDE